MIDQGRQVTSSCCTLLPWDTAFFGIKIARVESHTINTDDVDEILAWCRSHQVACLYFLADPTDRITVQVCEQNDFRFVDIRSTYQQVLKANASLPDEDGPILIRSYRSADLTSLQAIARTSYQSSRFYFDPGFSVEKCDALYQRWVQVDCSNRAAKVLVAAINSSPVGFITCVLNNRNRIGRISLLATTASFRGQGIGSRLVKHALAWFNGQGVRQVHVITQGRNIVAQRFYIAEGFNLHDLKLWYHKWFTPGESR